MDIRRLPPVLFTALLAGCSGWEIGGSAGVTSTGGRPVTIGATVRDVGPAHKEVADESPAGNPADSDAAED